MTATAQKFDLFPDATKKVAKVIEDLRVILEEFSKSSGIQY